MFVKKVFVFLISVLITASVCLPSVFAAEEKKFDISVSSTTAVPGDTVIFAVNIDKNPTITAVTITFHYDNTVLEFLSYEKGLLKRDTLADHKERGYVSVVYCDDDVIENGTLFGMKFKVLDTAQAGNYPVTVKNHLAGDKMNGTFANMAGDRLLPVVKGGNLEIKYNGSNCKHSFSSYKTVMEAGCENKGSESRSCTKCGHTELRDIEKLGHNYSTDWTIDNVATADSDGIMSRHCTMCEKVTDRVTFTLRDAEGNGFANAVGTVIKPNSWKVLEEIAPKPEEPSNSTVSDESPTESTDENPQISAEELLENNREQEENEEPERDIANETPKQNIFNRIADAIPVPALMAAGVAIILIIAILIIYIVKK